MDNLSRPGDLAGASAAIASGRARCIDVVQACLTRAAATEPTVHAFLHIDTAGALHEAAERDRELTLGRRRGTLHGIPVGVKDVIDVAGMPTTAGSRVLTQKPAAEDAEIVAALRKAGAVVLGKTNTHEFANGALTPPTRNPADGERIAGGSSGGSAAAVAAGSALLTVGTDTGGSVRLPAALCGVAGFRPRHEDRGIGMRGILPLAAEFDQWGLIAPRAADLAIAYAALSDTALPPVTVADLQIVVPKLLANLLVGHEPDVLRCFDEAIERLLTVGAQISTAALPQLAHWRPPRMAIQMQQMLGAHRRAGWWPSARDRYTDEVRANLDFAERQSAAPLDQFREQLRQLDAAVDLVLAGGSLLALPTVAVTAPKVSDVAQMVRGAEARHTIVGLLGQAVLPFSRGDLATMTIACGSAHRLPVGLQLVGIDDSKVLNAGVLIESTLASEVTAAPVPL